VERRDAPHRLGAEPGARPERGRGIEGDADERGLVSAELPHVLAVRRLHEGIDARESGLMAAAEAGDGPIGHRVRGVEPVAERPADLLLLFGLRDARETLQIAVAAEFPASALGHALPLLVPGLAWHGPVPRWKWPWSKDLHITQGCFDPGRPYYVPVGS